MAAPHSDAASFASGRESLAPPESQEGNEQEESRGREAGNLAPTNLAVPDSGSLESEVPESDGFERVGEEVQLRAEVAFRPITANDVVGGTTTRSPVGYADLERLLPIESTLQQPNHC